MMEKSVSVVDYELKVYFDYLESLTALEERIADLEGRIANQTYGLSSPRIKSTDEAKYQTSPKVHLSDLPLELMDRIEKMQLTLGILKHDRRIKQEYCANMARKLCDLKDDEKEIIALHYYDRYTMRSIAQFVCMSKTAVFNKINDILLKIEKMDTSIDKS